jgi:hypothetical protein
MQHAQILSIGDTSKPESATYWKDVLLPHVPEKLRHRLDFDECYKVFGGKLAHLADYVSEFVNSEGDIPRVSRLLPSFPSSPFSDSACSDYLFGVQPTTPPTSFRPIRSSTFSSFTRPLIPLPLPTKTATFLAASESTPLSPPPLLIPLLPPSPPLTKIPAPTSKPPISSPSWLAFNPVPKTNFLTSLSAGNSAQGR